MDTTASILTHLHEYAIHRSLPPWVQREVKKALLCTIRAERYLGIEHGRVEEALLEETGHHEHR